MAHQVSLLLAAMVLGAIGAGDAESPRPRDVARQSKGAAPPASGGQAVQARMWNDVRAGQPIVVHAVVALCDNKHQGIVPVPKALGDGQDPASNLYWGAGYGLASYFTRHAGWAQVRKDTAPFPGVLERIVLHRTVSRGGKTAAVYLVAEAWDGREIKSAIERFLAMAAGDRQETLGVSQHATSVSLQAGGAAHAVVYIGHNGLMDFSLATVPPAKSAAPPRSSIVLACASQAYFGNYLASGGSHPLLLTTNLMAPEAYTLDAALLAWAAAEPSATVREAAALAYDRFQKCGRKAARRLFTGSP